MAKRDADEAFSSLNLDEKKENPDASKHRRIHQLAVRECIICAVEKQPSQFIKAPHPAAKPSEHVICQDCWDQDINMQKDNKPMRMITCSVCDAPLGEPEIRRLSTRETYDK